MAKQKQETKVKSNAEILSIHQRVGYVPRDEYELFCEVAKKARVQIVERKMGDSIKVEVGSHKFYTDSK